MIVVPPVNYGGDHVNAKDDFDLKRVFSVRSVGGSGDVIIIAPLPSSDEIDSPYALIAITFAKTLAPQGRLNGGNLKSWTYIVQLVAYPWFTTLQPLRSVVNVTLSLYLIKILNPVIGEPPESGDVQFTITLSGAQVVEG